MELKPTDLSSTGTPKWVLADKWIRDQRKKRVPREKWPTLSRLAGFTAGTFYTALHRYDASN